MTGKLDPEERVLETLLKAEDLETGLREVGPGHLTQGYGFFGHSDDDRVLLKELKQHDDKYNYDTYSK